MVGEEDVISRQEYSCTVKCYSHEGSVYVLSKDHFMRIRHQQEGWKHVLEKALWKEKRKKEDFLSEHPKIPIVEENLPTEK